MHRDTALATAIAASLIYVIAVGVSSSGQATEPQLMDRPVSALIRFADSKRILRINNPTQMSVIAGWLDAAFENPRSKFDLRLLPPASNEIEVRFESGESTTIFFSGRKSADQRIETLRNIHESKNLYVVQYEGRSYTIDGVPPVLAGYLQLAERARMAPARRRPRSRYSHRDKVETRWPAGMIDHVEPDDEDED